MGYKTTISGILLLLSSASISAEGYRADSIAHLIHQPPIAAETLSSYRGGFMISDNYIINIGLSITATIDGMQIFNTQIANLKIENGDLRGASVTSSEASAIANVIQVGSGNDFQIGSGNAAEAIIADVLVINDKQLSKSGQLNDRFVKNKNVVISHPSTPETQQKRKY